MRAVVQRVSHANVKVNAQITGEIEHGFVVLLGISREDTDTDARYIAQKLVGLRVFDDAEGLMNLSLTDVGGEILLISQFTLYGDARKGRRPSFVHAAAGEEANRLYESVATHIREQGITVNTGIFGAMMELTLLNHGPVTILLDSKRGF